MQHKYLNHVANSNIFNVVIAEIQVNTINFWCVFVRSKGRIREKGKVQYF